MMTVTYATKSCPNCDNPLMAVILSAKGNRYECEDCGYKEEIPTEDYPPFTEIFVTGLSIADPGNDVKCHECKHLMFSDCYGECSKAHKGIVNPDDSCEYGEMRVKK